MGGKQDRMCHTTKETREGNMDLRNAMQIAMTQEKHPRKCSNKKGKLDLELDFRCQK
jgi:hypothetical protein